MLYVDNFANEHVMLQTTILNELKGKVAFWRIQTFRGTRPIFKLPAPANQADGSDDVI